MHPVRGNQGSTIITVIVALGIAGILISVLTTALTNQVKTTASIDIRVSRGYAKLALLRSLEQMDCAATLGSPLKNKRGFRLKKANGTVLIPNNRIGFWRILPRLRQQGGRYEFDIILSARGKKDPLTKKAIPRVLALDIDGDGVNDFDPCKGYIDSTNGLALTKLPDASAPQAFRSFYFKSGELRDCQMLCCERGDIAITGTWRSQIGEKGNTYPRINRRCLRFREGHNCSQGPAKAEIICGKL